MESTEQGWVILSKNGYVFYTFTFSRTRIEAQHKWVRLWTNPNNWKAHYNRGVRCVKASQTITLKTI